MRSISFYLNSLFILYSDNFFLSFFRGWRTPHHWTKRVVSNELIT